MGFTSGGPGGSQNQGAQAGWLTPQQQAAQNKKKTTNQAAAAPAPPTTGTNTTTVVLPPEPPNITTPSDIDPITGEWLGGPNPGTHLTGANTTSLIGGQPQATGSLIGGGPNVMSLMKKPKNVQQLGF